MITDAAASPAGRRLGDSDDVPNSQALRVNRPYEVFEVKLP